VTCDQENNNEVKALLAHWTSLWPYWPKPAKRI